MPSLSAAVKQENQGFLIRGRLASKPFGSAGGRDLINLYLPR